MNLPPRNLHRTAHVYRLGVKSGLIAVTALITVLLPASTLAAPARQAQAVIYLPLAQGGGGGEGPPATSTPETPTPEVTDLVAAILVDDGGSADPRISVETAETLLADVSDWFDEVSYGSARFEFHVHGWLDVPVTAGSATDPRIFAAAVAAGVDFRVYDHVLVLFHGGTGSGSHNRNHGVVIRDDDATYPLAATLSQITRTRDTRASRGVATHELGHALGLPHTNHLSQTTGQPLTYGNQVDTMGASSLWGHFNAFFKHYLGWLPDTDRLDVTESGDFELAPLQDALGRRLLVIPAESHFPVADRGLRLGPYAIETRRPLGRDANQRFNVHDGVLIYRIALPVTPETGLGPFVQALSIDASPETPSAASDDFALMPGRTFSDPVAGVHITALESTAEYSKVRIHLGPSEPKAPPILHALSAEAVDSAGTVRLSADASDPDGQPLHYFWNLAVLGMGDTTGRGRLIRYEPGTYATGASVVHQFDPGTPRTVCAIVSDGLGGQATGCIDLFGAQDEPPRIVRAAADASGPKSVHFSLEVADEQPIWVYWDYGDGNGSSYLSPQHTYAVAGEYTAVVTVTDGRHVVTETVAVDASQMTNKPPVADAGPDITLAPGGQGRLDGSASYDPDNFPRPLRYIWSTRSPLRIASANTAVTQVTAPAATGVYTVTLQVFDGELYASDVVTVTVAQRPIIGIANTAALSNEPVRVHRGKND